MMICEYRIPHYHLDQIRTFVQVVQDESFTQAAHSLMVAQGTVSTRIRELERTIGAELFLRSGRTIRLSEAGYTFLPYAKRLLEVADQGHRDLHQVRSRIAMGVIESLLGDLTLRAVTRFVKKFPTTPISVQTASGTEIIERLLDRTLNLGVLVRPERASDVWGYAELEEIAVLKETVRQFWHAVAQVGGFPQGASDGEPGWERLWHGWLRLLDWAEGISLANDLPPIQDVGNC